MCRNNATWTNTFLYPLSPPWPTLRASPPYFWFLFVWCRAFNSVYIFSSFLCVSKQTAFKIFPLLIKPFCAFPHVPPWHNSHIPPTPSSYVTWLSSPCLRETISPLTLCLNFCFRERPVDFQGGGLVFLEKKYLSPHICPKNISAQSWWKINISALAT